VVETHIDLFDGPSWDESEPKGYQAAPISRLKGAGEGLLGLGFGLAIPASFALALVGLLGTLSGLSQALGEAERGILQGVGQAVRAIHGG